jgi:hypothetical protein
LNGKIRGIEFDEPHQLLSAMSANLTEASIDTLNQVVDEWTQRLSACVNTDRHSVE